MIFCQNFRFLIKMSAKIQEQGILADFLLKKVS